MYGARPEKAPQRARCGVNELPIELIQQIFLCLETDRDKWAFLLTQRRWFECSIDCIWIRPSLSSHEQLAYLCRTLDSPTNLLDYASMVRRVNLAAVKHFVTDRALQAFEHCHELERLVLSGAEHISDDAIAKLAAQNPCLTSIDLSHVHGLTDATLVALADSCRFLQGIYVTDCRSVSDIGVEILAQSCPRLKRVRFSSCPQLSPHGVQTLASFCTNIVELDLSQAASTMGLVEDETVQQLLVGLRSLRELHLNGHTNLTDMAFAVPRVAGDLRLIDVSSCTQLTDKSVERLVRLAPRLHHVSLGRCSEITDASLFQLGKLGLTLHYLHLGHCGNLTDRGIVYVMKHCERLQYIDVANCMNLTNASVRAMSMMPRLRRIGLVKCIQIDDFGLSSLIAEPWPKTALERIHLSYCSAVTPEAVLQLINACPRLTHISLTGVQAFMRSDLTQFCRTPPRELTQHQQAVFCVYSGEGVQKLRDYLNHMAPENHMYAEPPSVAPPLPRAP